jgi:hypothetical protein
VVASLNADEIGKPGDKATWFDILVQATQIMPFASLKRLIGT